MSDRDRRTPRPAFAGVTGSGDAFVIVCDRWDEALARSGSNDAFEVILASDPIDALARLRFQRAAVCGLELMETRFVEALDSKRVPDSATSDLKRLRMVKTTDELDALRRAAALADLSYARFVEAAQAGMAEYLLVAEVEAFLK